MTRVKRGTISVKRRHNVLRRTKGFKWGGKSKERTARERLLHAAKHSFHDRRKKKRNFRALWQIRINAGVRENGMSYSVFMNKLKRAGIELDRKILSTIGKDYPVAFKQLIESVR